MEDKTKIHLTSAEMSSLWTQYINDTAAKYTNAYFLATSEDDEVSPIIEWTKEVAENNLLMMKEIFEKDNFPIPVGFTYQDVNHKAPKLFSDSFILMFLRQMSIIAMETSSAAIGLATRPDVVTFHKRILKKAVELQDRTRDLMLKQGIYNKTPDLPIPDKAEFIKKQHFLSGYIGNKRSLTSIEIANLFVNIETNAVGKALMIGFAQTAKGKEVVQFMLRGKKIAKKHMKILSQYLINEDLPVTSTWDDEVSDSTTPVFSDKIIMYYALAMNATGIGNYGMAMAQSLRRDLGAKYALLIPEAALYAEDGASLMIKEGWMEEPPQAIDRDKLAKS
ncbi:DUF3231 family protein [Pseudogracilibacillus sp. SE30717A]|uniref:DUF3231 family protein n=1 Tax=Pseudogracilibacillus sp. SE30717A TaxID=3098293 RepID=UPI00300E65CD